MWGLFKPAVHYNDGTDKRKNYLLFIHAITTKPSRNQEGELILINSNAAISMFRNHPERVGAGYFPFIKGMQWNTDAPLLVSDRDGACVCVCMPRPGPVVHQWDASARHLSWSSMQRGAVRINEHLPAEYWLGRSCYSKSAYCYSICLL